MKSLNRRRFFAVLAILLVLLLVGTAADRWSRARARQDADQAAAVIARNNQDLLTSELQKFRLLPLVLAEFPDVVTVLRQPDSSAVQRLDQQLELLAARTDAAVIYLIDMEGRTRAASNWRLPTSFVGQNYGFRPYFRDALRRGSSELFAQIGRAHV